MASVGVFFRNIDARVSVLQDLIGTLEHVVFARAGHPALDDWGLDAWLAYPHIIANTDALPTAPYGVMRSIIKHHGTDPDPGRRWFHSIAHDSLRRTFNHRFAPS